MAILAVYPRARTLEVAVWDGALYETSTFPFPANRDTLVEEELLPWLAGLEITGEDLQCIISSDLDAKLITCLEEKLDTHIHFDYSGRTKQCLPLASITGTPIFQRKCTADTFIFRYLVAEEVERKGLNPGEQQFIVAHLDDEIQCGALQGLTSLDTLTSFDEGPFGLRQSGGLPFDGLLDLCMGASSREEALQVIHDEGGLFGYLGLESIEELWTCRAEQVELIREALVYQIAKEIGALATVLQGDVYSIILSGGLTKLKPFVSALTKRIGFIAPISVYPGNQVFPALRAAALWAAHKAQESV